MLVYRCEIILAIRVTVQCMDMQILSSIIARLEHRRKTWRSIAKLSWLLWTDKNPHIPVYYTEKEIQYFQCGEMKIKTEIICTVIVSYLSLQSPEEKCKRIFFFFKERAMRMKWFSKYNKQTCIRKHLYLPFESDNTVSLYITFLSGLGYHFDVFHCCLEHFLCYNSWNIHLTSSFKIKTELLHFFPKIY